MAPRRVPKKKEEMLVNVQVNADDEIDFVPVEKVVDYGEGEEEEEEDDMSDNLDSDPDLVQTKDGRLMLTHKRTKCCAKCKKPFTTAEDIEAHKPKCPGVVDEATDTILKERKAAKHANPGDEFHKYCNPNPENPCYCCGEDISTAHVGHIRCKFCPKSFKAYEYLERHIRSVHSELDDFPCSFCNAKCASAEIQEEHLKTHSEGKPFACVICGKEFTRRYHLDRHVKHSNCGNEPKFMLPCEVCGKEFTRVDNLREHLRTHMGQTGRKRDYQCPYCTKSFYGSSLLNIHIRTHTGEKPFPCDLCPKSFPSSGALRKHRRKHTGERPYRCDECPATFAARETLNRHRKTHTGVKPHECKECGKRFIQATQLRTHMFTHTGTDGYQCKECGKAFARKSKLNEHIKYDHRGEQPYECDECSKKFFRRDELVRHMTVHTNKKDYKCPTCNNSYPRKASLTLHLKTHSLEEPAPCKLCSKSFLRMDCLLRHTKKRHPEYLSELIECTEKRKTAEVLAGKAATVEINGEVYQITSMEEMPKEPTFVLADPDPEPTMNSNSDSVNVLEVVELPLFNMDGSEETATEEPQTYELFPISDDTEVMFEEQHSETFDGMPVEETAKMTPTTGGKNRAEVKTERIAAKDKTKTPVKASKRKLKVDTKQAVELACPTLAMETMVEETKAMSPGAAVAHKQESENDTILSMQPKGAAMSPKELKTESPTPKAKETKPKTASTSKAPAKESTSVANESESKMTKRKRAREPKMAGGKRKRPDDDSIPIFLSDEILSEKISELLVMLIGEEMLEEFGWPETPVEDLLCQVILRCGHRPTKGEDAGDNTTRMRENTKILFSVTLDDEDIKALLNNHTVDEVIMHVLKSK